MHQREVGKADREIVRPDRVVGAGFRQPLGNDEIGLIGFQRAGKVALRNLHVADPVVAHRQIALPARIAWLGFRQPLSEGEAVGIGFQRAGNVSCAFCTSPTSL